MGRLNIGGQGGFSDLPVPEPVATSLMGYRTFGPVPVTQMLHGLHKTEYIWMPGKNEAICLRNLTASGNEMPNGDFPGLKVLHEGATLPVPECACGFWAYFDSASLGKYFSSNRIVGIMEGWGKMIVGPEGFRAQYAKIIALCPPEGAEVLPTIRAQYPGVFWYDDVHEMYALHPVENVYKELQPDHDEIDDD